jgi:predicted GNAT family acetyltransferase
MDSSPVVRDDHDNHRYVIEVDGVNAGHAVYHLRGGRHFFVHTEIDPGHQGQGLASVLIGQALDDVRAHGGSIVPLCPYVLAYVDSHPEYEDLVDRKMLEEVNRPY